MKPKPRCLVCGLVRSAGVHGGADWTHDPVFESKPRFGEVRQRVNPVSEKGAVRREEWREAKAVQISRQPTCEGPMSGLPGKCWGPIDVHHVIARGMGSGKDYGEYRTLCRYHHDWVERQIGRAHV